MILQNGKYPVREVVLHTAATPGDWWKGKSVDQIVKEIDGWHRQRGFNGIGYHRVFAPDGSMGVGRSIYQTGAHVLERNRGTVGLCMIPVKTHKGIKTFEDYFTEAQRAAVRGYIKDLCALTEIKWVTGHNDYANKECPGFKVVSSEWLP